MGHGELHTQEHMATIQSPKIPTIMI